MTRVLVVEDEESYSDALAYMLRKEGFEVAIAADGNAALAEFDRNGADIVLLDLMLPGIPGTEVCRTIRQTSNVPVIMVSAKDDEVDKVVGLELGADDYVTKPYSPRELVARIRAVLRRGTDPDLLPDTLEAGPVRMDVERHVVTVDGTEQRLPLKEFELLEMFLRNPGRVLTRGQLIDRVWGSDYVGDTKTLDVHVKRLRAKLEPEPERAEVPRHRARARLQARHLIGVRRCPATSTSHRGDLVLFVRDDRGLAPFPAAFRKPRDERRRRPVASACAVPPDRASRSSRSPPPWSSGRRRSSRSGTSPTTSPPGR